MRSILRRFAVRSPFARLTAPSGFAGVVGSLGMAACLFFGLTLHTAPAQQTASAPSRLPAPEAKIDLPPPAESVPPVASSMQVYSIRLRPGQDLKKELRAFTRRNDIQAGVILTCVGSLTRTAIRYANKEKVGHLEGHFEIVSLVGTLDPTGGHLHLSVSDGVGKTTGGHLAEGNIVYTTAEIVIGSLPDVRYTREKDATFGYNELVVHKRP